MLVLLLFCCQCMFVFISNVVSIDDRVYFQINDPSHIYILHTFCINMCFMHSLHTVITNIFNLCFYNIYVFSGKTLLEFFILLFYIDQIHKLVIVINERLKFTEWSFHLFIIILRIL